MRFRGKVLIQVANKSGIGVHTVASVLVQGILDKPSSLAVAVVVVVVVLKLFWFDFATTSATTIAATVSTKCFIKISTWILLQCHGAAAVGAPWCIDGLRRCGWDIQWQRHISHHAHAHTQKKPPKTHTHTSDTHTHTHTHTHKPLLLRSHPNSRFNCEARDSNAHQRPGGRMSCCRCCRCGLQGDRRDQQQGLSVCMRVCAWGAL